MVADVTITVQEEWAAVVLATAAASSGFCFFCPAAVTEAYLAEMTAVEMTAAALS